MSKKIICLSLLLFAFVSTAFAQFPDPYLNDDTRPDGT